MDELKTKGEEKQEMLMYKPLNAWEKVNEEERGIIFSFGEEYKDFLNQVKTEREVVAVVQDIVTKNGFIPLKNVIKNNIALKPGMKVYDIIKNKAMAMAIIGNQPLANGVNIIGSHIDSPRLDLKQNPLYENLDLALFKTHYYGGIKKYQWLAIPLAVHGVVIKENGESVNIVIGEEEKDPVFTITDLLPHLAQEQMGKKLSEAIQGEDMNVLIGSIPYIDPKVKQKVKLFILNLIFEKYGIYEEDFQSAELEIVPAFKARDVGFDRSLVGGYGQDDRACAFPSLKALLDIDGIPHKTAVCLFTDKEEIGSVGNTGARSKIIEFFLSDICNASTNNFSDYMLRNCLRKSNMLSADVTAGVDPNYENFYDLKNANYLGRGVMISKYTGSKGKREASDANPEFLGKIRKLFNENNIIWQSGEIGKVDKGGGGTIALYAANLGIEVLDCGVALLSMHSPFEITSKIDIYISYKAYLTFYKHFR
jgi:aspartyl aminopeptidase